MHNRFLQFIKKHALNDLDGKILLAISGGVDSMLLWHLVEQAKMDYAVAHCNFQLRGDDADGDEAFVRQRADLLGVECHSKNFDTKSYATINKVSTQMAARDLRYAWFDELLATEGYAKVYLAHHANDDVETVLLNLVRGTSIKGLVGMNPIRNEIVRPLLDITKEEIIEFAQEHSIEWREDASNAETNYKRNFVRKEIIPQLEILNPDFLKTMKRNMAKNEEVAEITAKTVAQLKTRLLKLEAGNYSISKADLVRSKVGPYVLSELLKDFGFNYSQSEEVVNGLDGLAGKVYSSATHELVIDRTEILIRQSDAIVVLDQQIHLGDNLCTDLFEYEVASYGDDLPKLDRNPSNAMFDLAKLDFPLVLRKWRTGDWFHPLGMRGQKLISDLLIDLKLSVFEKGNVYVLCSDGQIVWVIGYRISDKYKVDEKTTSVLHCQLIDRS